MLVFICVFYQSRKRLCANGSSPTRVPRSKRRMSERMRTGGGNCAQFSALAMGMSVGANEILRNIKPYASRLNLYFHIRKYVVAPGGTQNGF